MKMQRKKILNFFPCFQLTTYDERFGESEASCYLLTNQSQCREDPECVWCQEMQDPTVMPSCIQHGQAKQVDTKYH